MTDHIEPIAELLPCPFCGDEAAFNTVTYSENSDTVRLNGQATFHGVNCIRCGAFARGPVGFKTQAKAAEAWNRRAEWFSEYAEIHRRKG